MIIKDILRKRGDRYMATIVNNPGTSDSGSAVGMIVGVIVVLAIAFFFFVYGLPMMRQSASPQINVPGKIDVNVQGVTK
jgi:hypothetical protein